MNYLPFAEQCGLIEEHPVNHSSVEYLADLQKFAALVAAHEREECAKLCEELSEDWLRGSGRYEFMGEGAGFCADAIRERGQS